MSVTHVSTILSHDERERSAVGVSDKLIADPDDLFRLSLPTLTLAFGQLSIELSFQSYDDLTDAIRHLVAELDFTDRTANHSAARELEQSPLTSTRPEALGLDGTLRFRP